MKYVHQRKLVLGILWSLLSGILTVPVAAQSNPQAFWNAQMHDYLTALGNPAAGMRVQQIWLSLVQYSQRQYIVFPAQNFTAGQALPNGAILLDLSIAGNPNPEVTAFFLAHEWGHQVHGDPLGIMMSANYGPYIMAVRSKQAEDNADVYGARYLKWAGYDVQPVLDFLNEIPIIPGDTHSAGPQRAAMVEYEFEHAPESSGQSPPQTGHWEMRPVSRPLHPNGDLVPYMPGAPYPAMPCQHIVATPFGPRPMHPMGDMIIPCQHPIQVMEHVWVN